MSSKIIKNSIPSNTVAINKLKSLIKERNRLQGELNSAEFNNRQLENDITLKKKSDLEYEPVLRSERAYHIANLTKDINKLKKKIYG